MALPIAQLTAAKTAVAAGLVVREWGAAAAQESGPSPLLAHIEQLQADVAALQAAVVTLASAAGEAVPLELAHLVPEPEPEPAAPKKKSGA